MTRSRITTTPRQRLRNSHLKPTSQELDLLLLAGCSCLLTILTHPVAHTVQAAAGSGTSGAIATQVSRAPLNSMSPVHVVVPPEREKIKEEDEEG